MNVKLVAEIGINGNGNIENTKKLIDLAISGGCDYVKFQKRDIESCYTKEELDKPRESPFGTTNRDLKKSLEYSKEQYDEIDRYCKEKGVEWFASPWDIPSIDFLLQYNPKYIKIPSALITYNSYIAHLKNSIRNTETKIIIATGMSNKREIDECLDIIGDKTEYILSCVSTYPTKVSDINLKKILTLKEIYGNQFKIGYSNHSPSIQFILAAYLLEAEMIEYHITLDRSMFGSDQAASLEKNAVLKIKEYIDDYEKAWGDGKIKCLSSEEPIKNKLRKY